jgi:hypothetical protein
VPYNRVIPRDLFNEAKLLKCLGQLALLVHEGRAGKITLKHHAPGSGFLIDQDDSSGGLFCMNLVCRLPNRQVVRLISRYNSRHPYPLDFVIGEYHTTGAVFEEDGSCTRDFLAFTDSPFPTDPTGETE